MDQDNLVPQPRTEGRAPVDHGEVGQDQSRTGQHDGRGGAGEVAQIQADAGADGGELSQDDANIGDEDVGAHERELDDRMLEDEVNDEEQERRPEPVDDVSLAEYVDSLTQPRGAHPPNPGGGGPSAATVQGEPGESFL